MECVTCTVTAQSEVTGSMDVYTVASMVKGSEVTGVGHI